MIEKGILVFTVLIVTAADERHIPPDLTNDAPCDTKAAKQCVEIWIEQGCMPESFRDPHFPESCKQYETCNRFHTHKCESWCRTGLRKQMIEDWVEQGCGVRDAGYDPLLPDGTGDEIPGVEEAALECHSQVMRWGDCDASCATTYQRCTEDSACAEWMRMLNRDCGARDDGECPKRIVKVGFDRMFYDPVARTTTNQVASNTRYCILNGGFDSEHHIHHLQSWVDQPHQRTPAGKELPPRSLDETPLDQGHTGALSRLEAEKSDNDGRFSTRFDDRSRRYAARAQPATRAEAYPDAAVDHPAQRDDGSDARSTADDGRFGTRFDDHFVDATGIMHHVHHVPQPAHHTPAQQMDTVSPREDFTPKPDRQQATERSHFQDDHGRDDRSYRDRDYDMDDRLYRDDRYFRDDRNYRDHRRRGRWRDDDLDYDDRDDRGRYQRRSDDDHYRERPPVPRPRQQDPPDTAKDTSNTTSTVATTEPTPQPAPILYDDGHSSRRSRPVRDRDDDADNDGDDDGDWPGWTRDENGTLHSSVFNVINTHINEFDEILSDPLVQAYRAYLLTAAVVPILASAWYLYIHPSD